MPKLDFATDATAAWHAIATLTQCSPRRVAGFRSIVSTHTHPRCSPLAPIASPLTKAPLAAECTLASCQFSPSPDRWSGNNRARLPRHANNNPWRRDRKPLCDFKLLPGSSSSGVRRVRSEIIRAVGRDYSRSDCHSPPISCQLACSGLIFYEARENSME